MTLNGCRLQKELWFFIQQPLCNGLDFYWNSAKGNLIFIGVRKYDGTFDLNSWLFPSQWNKTPFSFHSEWNLVFLITYLLLLSLWARNSIRSFSQVGKSSGGWTISASGLRTSLATPFGQPVTHNPQPMQCFWSTTEMPDTSDMAFTWQRSMQVPQPEHSSGSMTA